MAAKKKSNEPADEIDEELLAVIPELRDFSKRLHEQLTEKVGADYTQGYVAAVSGLSQPTVSNLLTKPDRLGLKLATALKIAKGVGISLDVLLLGRQDPWKILKRVASQKGLQLDEKPPEPMPLGVPKPRQRTRRRT